MGKLIDIFGGYENVLVLLGTIVAGIWTVIKGTDIYDRWKERKWITALRCLEAGVEETYRVYVKEIKEASADGKLTDEERAIARAKATDFAISHGKQKGIDLLRELGKEYIPVLISRIVKWLKGRVEVKN